MTQTLFEKASRRIIGAEVIRLRSRNELADTFLPEIVRFILLPTYAKRLILNASDHSDVSLKRLLSLFQLASSVPTSVPGTVAEFGVAKGGTAGLLGTIAMGQGRDLWLFDSFEGLPEPDWRDGARAAARVGGKASGALNSTGACVGTLEEVRETLESRFRLPPDRLHYVQGWFQQTRGAFPEQPIAFLHLDCDWYGSVEFVLREYFDRVAPGGVIVFDDYGWWDGCARAVDEFMTSRGLDGLVRVGASQAYLCVRGTKVKRR